MIKIAHAADIHIRNTRYLDEIQYTFDRFYESLEEENVDLIYLGGDIFHSKLTVSNEYFDVASKFFRKLTTYAPVIVIPGNHDLSLNNKKRLDAITPVVDSLSGSTKNQIKYSKFSESFSLKNDEIVFHHFSILDKKEKWKKKGELNQNKINIALYHGCINGIKFDNGWISRGHKDDIDIFDGFDFAMLGDIHLHQFLNNKRVAYPGSIRQNNYGETIDKGYLIWEIESKNDFNVERVLLEQKRYFFTLYGSSVQDVKDYGELPTDCRIKFYLTKDVDIAEQLKIKSEIEKLYKPCNDVGIFLQQEEVSSTPIKLGNIDVLHENIREPLIQKELIKEFFKDKGVSDVELLKVHELDKVYHSYVETDVERNVIYKPKQIEWKNLFAYGKDNHINFDDIKGLIGIFGENASGKSSIMDIISLALTNTIYKKGAKNNIGFINCLSSGGELKMSLSLNNKDFSIKKEYKKKIGKTGERCETEVDFSVYENGERKSENGEKKPDTNKKIRDKFGTDEDLYFTSLCPQFGLVEFIDSRGTKRKETLAKYFDLDIFSTKYTIAKNDFDKLKIKLEDFDYSKIESDIVSKKLELDSINKFKEECELKKELEEKNLLKKETELKKLLLKMKSVDFTHEDLNEALALKKKIESKILHIKNEIKFLKENLEDFSYIGCSLNEFKEQSAISFKRLLDLESLLSREISNKKTLRKNAELLKQIPNVPQCQACSLAHHAFDASEEIPKSEDIICKLDSEVQNLKNERKNFDFDSIIPKWEQIKDSESKILLKELELKTLLEKLEAIEDKIEIININLEEILINDSLNKEINDSEREIEQIKKNINLSISDIVDLITKKAETISKIKNLEDKLELCKKLNEKKYTYELYLRAMGKNGISYWIISKKMPILNKQVNYILSQAVNFKLFIEDNEEDKSVKIFIVDKRGKRPIELGSGMEKTISSIALRAALWKVCLLPKMPILILDEAFAHLDTEKSENVLKLLAYLKNSYFDAIFVITHKEELKSVMDFSYHIKQGTKGTSKCQIGTMVTEAAGKN